MGASASELLHEVGHLGVLLLLFTIGLHLRFRSVLRTEMLGVARTGTAAYEVLSEQDRRPVGLDSDPGKIERH